MQLMKYLRACAVCKTYFPPTHWLCSLCWKALEQEYHCSNKVYRTEKTFPHLRLLDWHEDNHNLIHCFANSLKQGAPNFIFKRIGLEMVSRFIHLNLWNKKTLPLFIPSPPSSNSNPDHAFLLAKALSFYFGGEVLSILKKDLSLGLQKTKSKRERAAIQMTKENTAPITNPIVFVDDILTTGSTARAAFQALNKPKNFFIFTLIWRRFLDKKSSEED